MEFTDKEYNEESKNSISGTLPEMEFAITESGEKKHIPNEEKIDCVNKTVIPISAKTNVAPKPEITETEYGEKEHLSEEPKINCFNEIVIPIRPQINVPLEVKATQMENGEEEHVSSKEEIDYLNKTARTVTPQINVPHVSQKSDINRIKKLRNKVKKKKKKRKDKIHSDSLENKSVLVIDDDEEGTKNSKSDALSNGDDLCIKDFEVEISSFNLSKPVLLNLDTYRIESSLATINDVVSMEPLSSEPTENLEVSLDPDMFFPDLLEEVQIVDLVEDSSESDVSPKKEVAEVSLLTSSDEDDVILQEPYIETIEVSDACSDDEPLANLLNLQLPQKEGKNVKPKLKKYTCHVCNFWSYGKQQYNKHLSVHDWYFCTKCEFACNSESKLSRHYKTHIFNFLCERRTRRCKTDAANDQSRKIRERNSKSKKSNKRKKKSRTVDQLWKPSVEI